MDSSVLLDPSIPYIRRIRYVIPLPNVPSDGRIPSTPFQSKHALDERKDRSKDKGQVTKYYETESQPIHTFCVPVESSYTVGIYALGLLCLVPVDGFRIPPY